MPSRGVTLGIIIIKTSCTGSSGEKNVYKLLTQPHKHLLHEKTEKQTQGSNQRLTAPWNPSNVRCKTQQQTHEPGPAGNTLQIGTFYTLILQTLIYELQLQLGMSNSDRCRWKLAEQTIIRVIYCTTYTEQQHEVDDTTTRKSDHGKAWPPNTPGAREADDDIHQQTHTPENNISWIWRTNA